uniref:Protein phosphatase 1 regulatory subunit 37 n=1 Tax=Gadus morhua TaxID=8049 RepID=A0A8C5BZ83_GADMO
MNIEEQPLDLCNVKTQSSVNHEHNSSHTEGVLSRITELMMDGDTGKQNNVPPQPCETYLLPPRTDPLRGVEEDNHPGPGTRLLDELNGNMNSSGAPDGPTAGHPKDRSGLEETHGDIRVEVIEQSNTESAKFAMGDGGGDMDIGVDLSLDESGVLEGDLESPEPSVTVESSAAACRYTNKEAESPSERSQERTEAAAAPDQALLPPSLEDGGDHHNADTKKVTFPSDEDIVSGAVEPKDPWRHAQNVTVDEILNAYRQGCQKLNCKPIAKVLKQIQELKDLTQRNECLDLKGEKLDYKACESLEEVLKRVQFKLVDLEQTNLDEDGASALFDMIEYYESATHLNISFNKHIGTRGWQAAAHMMRKTSSLQYLDARNSPLLDHSAPFVARALRISGSLVVLHLENAGLSGRPLMLLATALKMNMNLRELYLADNKLNGLQDSAQLGNLLKFNYNIQILDLRNNHILDTGLAYVCEGLKEQRKGLVTLVLWNNQLTHHGMGYLAAALPCTQSLETLNLGHNSIGNEGVHQLKDGLISNRSVLRLGLASTKLSCEGAVAVAEFIAESSRLLRLDLRENEVKTGGLMALSLALKVNTSLLRLDLDREPKKETVKSFIETQRGLLAEIQNGCKRNFILAKEKEETDQKMRQSASMAEIATEDGPPTEEEPSDPALQKAGLQNQGDGEVGDGQSEKSSLLSESSAGQSESNVGPAETCLETEAPPLCEESDSDTEEEEEEEEVQAETSSGFTETGPRPQAAPPRGASRVPPPSPAVPIAGRSVLSAITVTESPLHRGPPPSPGRLIAVSSPGRGHKVFMVTRVESPPDQQQATGGHQNSGSRSGFTAPPSAESGPHTDDPRKELGL